MIVGDCNLNNQGDYAADVVLKGLNDDDEEKNEQVKSLFVTLDS